MVGKKKKKEQRKGSERKQRKYTYQSYLCQEKKSKEFFTV